MTKPNVGRPGPTEYASQAKTYVDLVGDGEITDLLSDQFEKTLALFDGVDDRHASEFTYAPGKWTLKQVIGHMGDTERIFAYRALRIGRGDETPLPGFEQDDYVRTAESNERKLTDLTGEFRVIRHSTLSMIRGFPEAAWSRSGKVNNSLQTVRGIVFTAAGHELHHYNILRERYGLS